MEGGGRCRIRAPGSSSHLHGGAVDSWTGTCEKTDWDHEQGAHATKLLTELWNSGALTGSRLRLGALGARAGWLAAGGVRNKKDRDAPALEVRAGTPGVGCTFRDAAGLSSTNRNRVKVARTSVENRQQSLCSVTEAEIWPLLL